MDDIFVVHEGYGSADIGDDALCLFLWQDLLPPPTVVEIAILAHVLEEKVKVEFIVETFVEMDDILMFDAVVDFDLSEDVLLEFLGFYELFGDYF
jgi:hypothetical protein